MASKVRKQPTRTPERISRQGAYSKKVAIAFPRDGSHRDIDSSPTLSVALPFRG